MLFREKNSKVIQQVRSTCSQRCVVSVCLTLTGPLYINRAEYDSIAECTVQLGIVAFCMAVMMMIGFQKIVPLSSLFITAYDYNAHCCTRQATGIYLHILCCLQMTLSSIVKTGGGSREE